jgi:hypothetical protein
MIKLMKFRILILAGLILPFAGCRTAKDVAVTSFRVIDAPAHYIRRHIDEESPTTATTTATATKYQSDAVTPGTPVGPNPPSSQSESVSEERPSAEVETKKSANRPVPTGPKPKPTPVADAMVKQSPEIPYAKPVPGKPGYVYSPFDTSGGYVDVTGYKPGSKVKDPYSGKIFMVP